MDIMKILGEFTGEQNNDMRILHFEDNTTKYMAIHSVVQSLGIEDITWVESVEEGLECLRDTTSSYDVILSDMHFPITKWGKPEWEAGDRVIQEVKKRGLDIPVIIISSAQMRVDGAYAAIWYSDSRDWESELRKCLQSAVDLAERLDI